MNPMTWIQTRWCRLRAAHRAELPALTVIRAQDLVARHPECGPAWRLLGSALVELARYEDAEAAIRRSVALCPTDLLWIPLAEMGHLERTRGDYRSAAAWYRRAVDAAPEEAGPRIFLGGILARSGQLIEAEEALRAATLCEFGRREEAYLNLGLVLRALDRHEEAAACLEAALGHDPKDKAAKVALRDVRQAARGRGRKTRRTSFALVGDDLGRLRGAAVA